MTEYATAIEVWFDAKDEFEASELAKGYGVLVLEQPNVVQIEVEAPEEL